MPDLSQIDQLRAHLERYGLFAKKSFGQNFLVDAGVLDQIVGSAELAPDDHVVEVGAGPGVLSQRLAPQVGQLTSLEIDEQMIAPWQDLMANVSHAEIKNQDVLDFFPEEGPYKVVANIPYYITSPILKHFLRHQQVRRPDLIVLMIQKEVAQRICDVKKPTLLSWEIRVFGEPEMIYTVPPSSFYPSPKVDSAILKIRVLDQPLAPEEDLDAFFALLEKAYKQPRKTLLNNLSAAWGKERATEVLERADLDGGLRPHQLSLEHWKQLLTSLTGS